MRQPRLFATALSVWLYAFGLFPAQAAGPLVTVYTVSAETPGPGSVLDARLNLEAEAVGTLSPGRIEALGSGLRWFAGFELPFRELRREALVRRGGFVVERVELELARAPLPMRGAKTRKVSFTLAELLAAPFGTRSPSLNALLQAAKETRASSSSAWLVTMSFDPRRQRFDATVGLSP